MRTIKTIGLCMIVKDEAHVITRCLESALPLVDYVSIIDTGSSDGTQEIIRQFLQAHQLSGQVLDEPWQNFAYNRSFALKKLRENVSIDYSLMLDADSVLVFEPGFDALNFKSRLTADVYDVTLQTGSIVYQLPLLVSNRKAFGYRGVLHEFLDLTPCQTREDAKGFVNRHYQDSSRNQNVSKYAGDAAVLEKALAQELDPFLISRYTFYLAQSYRSCGHAQKAIEAYQRRAELGFWEQEVCMSHYYCNQLKESLHYPVNEVIQGYLAAYEICPYRAEPLHGAIKLCRLHNKFQQGYLLAKYAVGLPVPANGLFVEQWIYDYALLDEFSIVAYWAGHYRESFDACLKLLKDGKTPPEHHDRIRKNAEFAIDKLNNPQLRSLLPL